MGSYWLHQLMAGSSDEAQADRRLARMKARNARRRKLGTRVQDRLEELEDEVGELRLFSRALLALLQETGALDPRRLREKLREIDAADGTSDGRFDPQPKTEPKPEAPVRRKDRR